MKDELTPQQAQAVLDAFDEALAAGPWEQSNFLRIIGKNLREIRDNFASQLEAHDNIEQAKQAKRFANLEAQQEVFISVYSSEGNNIPAWERIIANLQRFLITRPIYANEEHIKSLIRSKDNKLNEAYLAVYVNKDDILVVPQEKIAVDKFGKPLMTLKDKSLNLENITRFVHYSGTYKYEKGRLIKNQEQQDG
ncbi:Dot/Icm secretion system protein IcmQ [Legionella dresdenensis]|uniref:Dot/Icm secretion system protein IcmQ n=1 Tax=Legionella dresdenensis TaxID=450200 RepID=A0ABV8CEB9_9GAMM